MPEAAALLAAAGDVPDHAPFYVVRAKVTAQTPEQDLRRAVVLDPAERTIHIPLVQYLQDQGRWEDALDASSAARDRFPDDFNLDLLHVRALNETQRFRESIEIVDEIHVLPSEHASESHRLFADAHTMAAFEALERGDPSEAERHLEIARTWPERLGLGRPYEPEERLQRFLLAEAAHARGDDGAARGAYEAVVASTQASGAQVGGAAFSRFDLLAIVAAAELGRGAELGGLGASDDDAVGRIVAAARSAQNTGGDVRQAVVAAARDEMRLFADVEGRLLYRALALRR